MEGAWTCGNPGCNMVPSFIQDITNGGAIHSLHATTDRSFAMTLQGDLDDNMGDGWAICWDCLILVLWSGLATSGIEFSLADRVALVDSPEPR